MFQNADCDPSHTLHVDAFLYDEDMVDELCDTGELARNYCVDCSSHNTQPISELNINVLFLYTFSNHTFSLSFGFFSKSS